MIAIGALLVADAKTIGVITIVEISTRCADGFFSYKDATAYELHAHLASGSNATVACVDTEAAALALLTTYAKMLDFAYVAPRAIARRDDVAVVYVYKVDHDCTSFATTPIKDKWRVWMRIGTISFELCCRTFSNFKDAEKYVSMYLDARNNDRMEDLHIHTKPTIAAAEAAGKQ